MAEFLFAKVDQTKKQIFGFANVSVKRDGGLMTDLQGDQIPPDVLEEAAYDFCLRFREAGEMHVADWGDKGRLIESVVITAEKCAAWGLPGNAIQPRWWVGFQLDADTFAKVQSGQYRMFSIQGKAVSEEVPD